MRLANLGRLAIKTGRQTILLLEIEGNKIELPYLHKNVLMKFDLIFHCSNTVILPTPADWEQHTPSASGLSTGSSTCGTTTSQETSRRYWRSFLSRYSLHLKVQSPCQGTVSLSRYSLNIKVPSSCKGTVAMSRYSLLNQVQSP